MISKPKHEEGGIIDNKIPKGQHVPHKVKTHNSDDGAKQQNVEIPKLKLKEIKHDDHGKMARDEHKFRLQDSVECAEDVKRFCSDRTMSSNFMVLDCLQDDEKTNGKVSHTCHDFLWNYKLNLTRDQKFDKASEGVCKAEFARIIECGALPMGEGQRIPCLIEHYEELETQACQSFINKMASIIFSDYRYMQFFIKDCGNDIEKYSCGRMESELMDDSPHSQGQTIECLHDKDLTKMCRIALFKVAELQSDDYHLDRPLYYACKADREDLCHKVPSGDGQVFKCLYKHLEDPKLSKQCKLKLEDRQKLIAEDVKADKSFYDACKKDIKANKCGTKKDINMGVDQELEEDLHRSEILLCLEDAQANGVQLEAKCMKEMFDMRESLMQDYNISPELVKACQSEINEFCEGLEPDGESVHCLMEAAKDKHNRNKFSSECRAAVDTLLKVANPGQDIRLDPPLMRACGEVVIAACGDLPKGEGNIMTCLLDNLDHEDMTDECEDMLLQIQYFAVREFKLDHHLFKMCKKDAKEMCPQDFNPETNSPEMGPLVFSCLHRLYRSQEPSDKKLSRGCQHEVKRVMRERGDRINLHPEVESNCMEDLSEHCSDNEEHTDKGGEMECLQMNLEDLRPNCAEKVREFTIEETEEIEMDKILMRACTPMIQKYCKELLDSDATPTDVLNCLVDNKHRPEMDGKCLAGIEHHQIISLQDFRFNRKFREACSESVDTYCKNKKTGFEVVSCLSEHVRNDTLMDKEQRIDRPCQRQLRAELLSRSESIKLDPLLEKACGEDIKDHCAKVKAGEAQVIDCLKHHKKKLTKQCRKKIFKRQQEEAFFGDYDFLHVCKQMIKTYCRPDSPVPEMLQCLIEHREETNFDDSCAKVVMEREEQAAKDFRLDPYLQKACMPDIQKHCNKLYQEAKDTGEELQGKVINCLKKKFTSKDLTRDCEQEIKLRIKESAMDINQNPVMMQMCHDDINDLCKEQKQNVRVMNDEGEEHYKTFGQGAIIECLKRNFAKLKNGGCKKEVAYMIAESRVDVHIDPLLNSACQKDLITLCGTEPQGMGRKMSCLLANLEHNPKEMSTNCLGMLKRRKELWEYAAQVAPAESFQELYEEISASPHKNYFMAVFFTVVGVIFIVGLTCGRVTKKVRAELKNK